MSESLTLAETERGAAEPPSRGVQPGGNVHTAAASPLPRSVSASYWDEDVARDALRDWVKYERPDASTPEQEWLRQAQDAERGKTVSIWRRPRA